MLNFNTLISGATLAFIGWIAFSVVELKTETAVISVKVDQNHKTFSRTLGLLLTGESKCRYRVGKSQAKSQSLR